MCYYLNVQFQGQKVKAKLIARFEVLVAMRLWWIPLPERSAFFIGKLNPDQEEGKSYGMQI